MQSCTHVFQISGIKTPNKKRRLIQGIHQLDGKYIGGSVYQHASTHLIIPQVLSSEKFLAACAAGKWVVTPEYVLDSVKNGSWLAEEPYEVGVSTGFARTSYPVRQWREKVASGRLSGAFQDWRVLLLVTEPASRGMYIRLLKAGGAEVYHCPPPAHTSITHIMAKPVTENSKSHNAPCYPVSYIVEHLLGSKYVTVNFSIQEEPTAEMKARLVDADFCHLKAELKNYINKREGRPRLCFLEFLGCHAPRCPPSQATETDFSNISNMIECGLFREALDSIRSTVFPGVLPPASNLISLMEYAQQGDATSVFLRSLHCVLDILIISNPPCLTPGSVKNYFTEVFQCPRCKAGPWPFLQTAIRYCLSSEATCHPLPGPALPILLDFHYYIVTLFLRIFQGEFHALTVGDLGLTHSSGVSSASASGSLLFATFWTVWERSTLLCNAVKQLTQLLIEAATVDYVKREEKQKLLLADTLVDLLSVLVEFWCQLHIKLNPSLMEKGLKDLSEHLAVISQDVSPVVLGELVIRVHSTRLKLMVADAMFRNVCSRNGFAVGDDPLSFRKMVLSYLPLLGSLAQSPSSPCLRSEPTPCSCTSQGSGCRAGNSSGSVKSPETENIPRGLKRVNVAGETLLHRACKKNQVETVLQILTLPGTDVNVKDHAGWTPLHEACNHGSTECVAALLRHHPAPAIDNQVGGVTPLHDALVNGNVDIAKLLLEHGGSVLLQQTDGDGRHALDLVSTPHDREELLHSAQVGDATLRRQAMEVLNLPLLEAGSTLLAHLIVTYHRERGVPHLTQPNDKPSSLGCRLAYALRRHSSHRVTAGWMDPRAVRLVEDAETLLELSQGKHRGQVARAVRECGGENTAFLMEIVDNLKSRGDDLKSQGDALAAFMSQRDQPRMH